MKNVLIFTPTWGDVMRPETVAAIEAQTFGGGMTWEVSRHNPFAVGDHRNVLAQYQRARELFLAGGWDALWTVEHDIVPPPHALQRMYDTPADVVYGVYLLRHGHHVLNAFRYDGDRNVGMSLSFYPDELRQARKRGAARVSGCGFGCMLIRWPVLDRFAIRSDTGDQVLPDLPLAQDVLRAGIPSVARFDVACDHFDGEVRLRAYGDGVMDKVKVKANVTLTALVNGGPLAMEAGGTYDLPREVASDLKRAGYISILDDEPETAALKAGETAVKNTGTRKEKGSR